MTDAVRAPGSFRDPSGHVFLKDGRVYRTISNRAVADFDFVAKSGLLEDLTNNNLLVPWWEVRHVDLLPDVHGVAKILELEGLDFITYPYEWSFAGLKVAALTHIHVQLLALAKGVTLSDATAYNIQFKGHKPIFIDHLSFRPYNEGEFWHGHLQFCEQFLNPLLLRAKLGVPHNVIYRGAPEGLPRSHLSSMLAWRTRLSPRVITHVTLPAWLERRALRLGNSGVARTVGKAQLPRRAFENMLRSLRGWVESLHPRDTARTVWSSYTHTTTYSTNEMQKKRAFVAEFAERTKPAMLWDIGCNTGEYSELALEAGARLVIGFENDTIALEKAFQRSQKENLQFLPIYLDAANPSPTQGWKQAEYQGFKERRSPNALLALALIHHLCIGRNIPLTDLLTWLVELAPQGVIEFVPKQDPMVRELVALRKDVFDDYSEEAFDHAMLTVARIVKSEVITESGRRLIWYERR